MSELLEYLQQVHAFNPTPRQAELGWYHVAFDELVGDRRVEERLDSAVRGGGRVALIGESGCGKSSVIWSVLNPLAEGVAPIAVPVAAMPAETMVEPVTVADQLIRVLARHAQQAGSIDEGRQREALQWAQSRRAVRTGRTVQGRIGLPWLGGQLAIDVRNQTQGAVDIGPEEKLEVVDQLLASIAGTELVPILVFDDTDRWIDGLGHTDPGRVISGFFGRVLRWAADLRCAVVVAVHTAYFNDATPRHRLLEAVETPIDVPRLRDEASLARLFERRLAWFTDETALVGARVEEVFAAEAVAALFRWYREHDAQLRDVVRVAHIALTEACDSASDQITAPLIATAVAAR